MALLFVNGCAAGQSISQEKLQEKVGKIQVGFTTQKEIENLFGTAHMTENRSWTYSLSDTGLENSPNIIARGEQRRAIPIPTTMPTNTRALVTVRFNENDTVNALEVAQFFNIPFINYYHYFLDRNTDRILESATRAGEMSNFRVADFDKSAGRFVLLEDGASDTRIIVKLEKQILHITSINFYDRMSNEYRLFRRREGQFIERISAATETEATTHARP
jgi:hypothetical protein